MYFVFHRSDGHVGVINARTRAAAQARFDLHTRVTFEILLETDDWIAAEELIRIRRGSKSEPKEISTP